MGYRDQARAGARSRRLSGVHPQGHDRPLLCRLHAQAARGAASALPAIRHPQCAHRGERDRRCRRRRRLRVPAPARHGRGALPALARRPPRSGVPDLRSGRRASRSSGLSRAASPRKRREFLLRVGCRRSRGADRVAARASAGPHRRRAPRAQPEDSPAARPLRPGAAQFLRRRIRRPSRSRCAARRNSRGRAAARGMAAHRRRETRRHRARRGFADRRQGDRPRRRRRRCHRGSGRGGGAIGLCCLGCDRARRASRRARTRGRSPGSAARPADRAVASRRRQDARRRGGGSPRGDRFLPLLRRRGAPHACSAPLAGPDRGNQRASLPRPRRVRLHQPMEFSALDLSRSGQRRARCRQCRSGEARRADAPDRRRGGARLTPSRRSGERAASAAGRRQGRSRARRRPARRRRRLHRLDRSRARDQSRAGGEGGGHRAADRGDRRHQSDDRRRDRAAGASHGRRDHVGIPFRRPALLGAASAVPTGGRGRAHRRDDCGRRARAQARRPARAFNPYWAGDRCRGQGQARPLDRRLRAKRPRALPLGPLPVVAGERDLCAARHHHARAGGGFARRGVRADPTRRALACRGA